MLPTRSANEPACFATCACEAAMRSAARAERSFASVILRCAFVMGFDVDGGLVWVRSVRLHFRLVPGALGVPGEL